MQEQQGKKQQDRTQLLNKLKEKASKTPEKIALTFLKSDGTTIEDQYTYKYIELESTRLAISLLEKNKEIRQGDRAVLVYPPGLEFILSFLSCLKCGIIAVPVYPPHPQKRESLIAFSKIVEGCGATFALSCKSYNYIKKLANVKSFLSNVKRSSDVVWPEGLKWIITDTMKHSSTTSSTSSKLLPTVHRSDMAFLQFTSGSTSDPKGVMISHDNLSHNLGIIMDELHANEETVVVSWLPQYHDMGLIGSYLGVLYCGGCGYYMSPISFLQRPMTWIECMSLYKATHVQAPNFAYKLTARKFDHHITTSNSNRKPLPILDLSSIKHMINGAEPIDFSSMQLFYDTFCPFGLPRNVIFPTYGLAEHTVFVCSGGEQILTVDKTVLELHAKVVLMQQTNTTDDALHTTTTSTIVGCGYPSRHDDVDLRIVNADTNAQLEEDEVGEIWISSPSVALGYYNQTQTTKSDFQATLLHLTAEEEEEQHSQSHSSKPFLRTGDLGFLHKNELFLCGRKKDLIILNGRNYYPQDIESTAEDILTVDVIRPGCTAAFDLQFTQTNDNDDDNNDAVQIILLVELRNTPSKKDNIQHMYDPLCTKLHSTIQQEHGIPLTHVIFLQPRTIPKTTSGKIARSWCRKAYEHKSLQIIYSKSYNIHNTLLKEQPPQPHTTELTTQSQQQQQSTTEDESNTTNIKNLTNEQIKTKLLQDISRIVNIPPNDIYINQSLLSQFDSLSISQCKALLENNYQVRNLSDEYLFQDNVTIDKLIEVVKLGYAPDDVTSTTTTNTNTNTSSKGGGGGGGGGGNISSLEIDDSTGVVVDGTNNTYTRRKTRKSFGEMLGCPPGVVKCAIM